MWTGTESHKGSARSALGRINCFTQGKGHKDTGGVRAFTQNHHHIFSQEKPPSSIAGAAETVVPETPERLGDLKPEKQPKPQQHV